MTLGFRRLNERQKRPNENIDFIKPDPNASEEDQAIAQHFLSKIAAQCFPVMKEDHLFVRSLEEYAPNPEFLGRNFNAGECIQLVLKDKKGRWLAFKYVQMVMMHELAHCKQMNHSRYFWAVRNQYAEMMEGLWAKNYQGEGMWGRGQDLTNGQFVNDRMPEDVDIPEHLCGGTYRRSRGKKRKRGAEGPADRPRLSYAERQQKRIAKKFGKHGEGSALGDDELVRGALDRTSGKRHAGKPRVANSKRGRDLRASAALARFEAAKTKTAIPPERTPELDDDDDDGSGTDSGWSSDEDVVSSASILLRRKAGQINKIDGETLIKVCGGEGDQEDGGQDEMDALRLLSVKARTPVRAPLSDSSTVNDPRPMIADSGSDTESDTGQDAVAFAEAKQETSVSPPGAGALNDNTISSSTDVPASSEVDRPNGTICPICSLENDLASPTCIACSHVLKLALVKDHWSCRSAACVGSKYVNAGDFGRCGVCGGQKPDSRAADGKPMEMTTNDLLRWD
ncbi:hypothetical protein BAUCODRAFT_21762 [Baudoinia panamericana UAMH 10762]|uniref:WLM domain-containing protein n=1 Tax=Baudoinia panamericana (strain UAMH 10762) TaxID=717646 RepID=M2NKW9_BAUPA|nr:uncharacterized protein BAUCODRAFT_21762 [Baudoinia panamericana UAMH 10762]EMD00105.1 hypothetical protein BAUCODRAFT_21762 [Baudoinia panamericana UAMH 10762]